MTTDVYFAKSVVNLIKESKISCDNQLGAAVEPYIFFSSVSILMHHHNLFIHQLPYSSHYLSTDSLDHFFRLWNGQLHRWQEHHSNWRTVEIKEKLEAKSVLSINGQPVIVTKSGNLKMIGSGGGYSESAALSRHNFDKQICQEMS